VASEKAFGQNAPATSKPSLINERITLLKSPVLWNKTNKAELIAMFHISGLFLRSCLRPV